MDRSISPDGAETEQQDGVQPRQNLQLLALRLSSTSSSLGRSSSFSARRRKRRRNPPSLPLPWATQAEGLNPQTTRRPLSCWPSLHRTKLEVFNGLHQFRTGAFTGVMVMKRRNWLMGQRRNIRMQEVVWKRQEEKMEVLEEGARAALFSASDCGQLILF